MKSHPGCIVTVKTIWSTGNPNENKRRVYRGGRIGKALAAQV